MDQKSSNNRPSSSLAPSSVVSDLPSVDYSSPPPSPTSVQSNVVNPTWVRRSIRTVNLSRLSTTVRPRLHHQSLRMAQRTLYGYAHLPRYQYHNFNTGSLQYATVPVFSAPPPPPVLEPPTNHPVEKDEEEEAAKEADAPPEDAADPVDGITHAIIYPNVTLILSSRSSRSGG